MREGVFPLVNLLTPSFAFEVSAEDLSNLFSVNSELIQTLTTEMTMVRIPILTKAKIKCFVPFLCV